MTEYLWMLATAFIAYISGRNVIAWTIATYLFGWVAFVVVAFLPKKQTKSEERSQRISEFAERHALKKEVGNFNTVDDLFKQLETNKQ